MYNANDEQKKNKACYSNAADKSARQTSPGRIHSIIDNVQYNTFPDEYTLSE